MQISFIYIYINRYKPYRCNIYIYASCIRNCLCDTFIEILYHEGVFHLQLYE